MSQGFTKDALVPDLKVECRIEPAAGSKTLEEGTMVTADGPHNGATVAMPKEGQYTLIYRIAPPTGTLDGTPTQRPAWPRGGNPSRCEWNGTTPARQGKPRRPETAVENRDGGPLES